MPLLNIVYQFITSGFGSSWHWIFPLIGLVLFIIILVAARNIPKGKQDKIQQEAEHDKLRQVLNSAKVRAKRLFGIETGADIEALWSPARLKIVDAHDRYETAMQNLKKKHPRPSEYKTLITLLETGQAYLNTAKLENSYSNQSKSEIDSNSTLIVEAINHIVSYIDSIDIETPQPDQSHNTNNQQQKNQLISDISHLIIEGTKVLTRFNSILLDDPIEEWPVQQFKDWRTNVYETLVEYNMDDHVALFFRVANIDLSQAILSDYIQACEAGLKQLEEALKESKAKI